MACCAPRSSAGAIAWSMCADAWPAAPRSCGATIGAAASCCGMSCSPCRPRCAFLFTSRSFVLEQGYGSQKGAPGELLPTGATYRRAARCTRLATGCSCTGGASGPMPCRPSSMRGAGSLRTRSSNCTSTTLEDLLGPKWRSSKKASSRSRSAKTVGSSADKRKLRCVKAAKVVGAGRVKQLQVARAWCFVARTHCTFENATTQIAFVESGIECTAYLGVGDWGMPNWGEGVPPANSPGREP